MTGCQRYVIAVVLILIAVPPSAQCVWKAELLVQGGLFFHNSVLNTDPSGAEHFSFIDPATYDVIHARRFKDEIEFDLVGNAGSADWGLSETMDTAGVPYVCFFDQSCELLKLAEFKDGHWLISNIDTVYYALTYIVINADGNPSICYRSLGHEPALKIATRKDGEWFYETIESGVFRQPSMVIDSTGICHIVYTEDSPKLCLKYACQQKGQSWKIEIVDDIQVLNCSLAIDSWDNISIAYTHHPSSSSDAMIYAKKRQNGWEKKVIDYVGTIEWRTLSLALDPSGLPHIAYENERNNVRQFVHAAFDGKTWNFDLIDGNLELGGVSLIIAKKGQMQVLYCCASDTAWDIKSASYYEPTWKTCFLESRGQLGSQRTTEFDSNGNPHVVYFLGSPEEDLRYLERTADTWHFETIDSEGSTGWGLSIALDKSDQNHISYYDASNDRLMYARSEKDCGGWRMETVNSASFVHSSIAIDSYGNPAIAYSSSLSGGFLGYAVKTMDGWKLSVVDEGEFHVPQINFDSKGVPQVVYCSSTGGIHHAWLDIDSTWKTETIADADVFEGALAIDADDLLHVCFTAIETPGNTLWYATRKKDGSWITQRLISMGYVAGYNSIAVDDFNDVCIAYASNAHDNLSLWTARKIKGIWDYEPVIDLEGDLGGVCLDIDSKGFPGILYAVWMSDKECYETYYAERKFSLISNPGAQMRVFLQSTEEIDAGESFSLTGMISHEGKSVESARVFFLLEAGSNFWIWPEWTPLTSDSLPGVPVCSISGDGMTLELIPQFIWPDFDPDFTGACSFYGAVMNEDMTELISDIQKRDLVFSM